MTSLASFAVLLALGADLDRAVLDMPLLLMPVGRGDEAQVGQRWVIDDSYNANPVSMRYALESLGSRAGSGQKVAVLGEMLELGAQGPELHQQMVAACTGIDGVITVGEGFSDWDTTALGERYWGHFRQAADIELSELTRSLQENAVILVKGSNRVFWVNGFVDKFRRHLAAAG